VTDRPAPDVPDAATERLRARTTAFATEFDARFARPRPAPAERAHRYLAIRAAGRPLALPLAGLAGIAADRHVVPVPGGSPALLGLASVAGRLVAAFDLGALLGLAPASTAPRWLATLAANEAAALAFEALEGQLEARADELRVAARLTDLVRQALPHDAVVRDVIDLDSLGAVLARARPEPAEA